MIFCTKRIIIYSIRRINNKQILKQKVFSGTESMPYELEIEYKRQTPLYSYGHGFGNSFNLGLVSLINLWGNEPEHNYFQIKYFKTEKEAKEFGETLREGMCQKCGETTKCVYVNHF